MIKRPRVNIQIRAAKVRVVDEAGKQTGVIDLQEALRIAKERDLDLIQVTTKAEPPVCKIMDYGKFLYSLKKKEAKAAQKTKGAGQTKEIRLTFNISPHDMETRAKTAERFLKKGNKIKIELKLRGRQKALGLHARGKIKTFLEILNEKCPIKIERELKRETRGFTIIVSKE